MAKTKLIALLMVSLAGCQAKPTELKDSIAAIVALDENQCGPEAPLKVTIENKSRMTVTSTTFAVSAYERDHSGRRDWGASGTSDRILEPGESEDLCIEKPDLYAGIQEKDILYKVKVTEARASAE